MISNQVAYWKDKALLSSFLDTWPISRIKNMTIKEYTDVNNPETFTRWVEGKTRHLGSINSIIGSAKFGIYKRDKSKKPRGLFSNETHSWIKYYGPCGYDEQVVFKKVKEELITLIKQAIALEFEAIEKSKSFYELYKWKVAFLYSNESFIPVFNQKYLKRFTNDIVLPNPKKIEYAKRHKFLFDKKPGNLTVFNYMRLLVDSADSEDGKKRKRRRGVDELNADDQKRSGSEPTLVTQLHKKMQRSLKKYLNTKYPEASIKFEKNFIDLLLVSNSEVHFYEVKTASSPESCIKQGLGQLLSYFYYETKELNKFKNKVPRLFIFGLQKGSSKDNLFVDYINLNLQVDFQYLSLEEIKEP